MIVNLYVDHLMKTSPASAEEFWNATREHPQVFAMAAHQVGLTGPEYAEFRQDLLAGKAIFVKLPRHLDAMSGQRRGYVYAVKQAVVPSTGVLGWEVTLRDGAQVYVPQVCGNISLLRPAPGTAVAYHAPKKHGRVSPVVYRPTAVDVEAPAASVGTAAAPVAPAGVVAYVPAEAVAAHTALSPLYALPLIGGLIAGLTHGGGSTTPTDLPPCSQGSNDQGMCSK